MHQEMYIYHFFSFFPKSYKNVIIILPYIGDIGGSQTLSVPASSNLQVKKEKDSYLGFLA